MANHSVLSVDSLGESELDLLRDKLKQKDHIIAEKTEIISSLRQQVNDLNSDLEEMENNQQLLNQKVDRLTRDLGVKDEELEAVSHALKEVETAHETLSKRLEARTGQLQKFVEDLVAAKKQLETVTSQNEELKHKNEQLAIELEIANSKRRASQEQEQQLRQQSSSLEEREQLSQRTRQHTEYRPQLHSTHRNGNQKHQLNRLTATQSDEARSELATALHFPMADEIGEIMDSSSAFPPKPFCESSRPPFSLTSTATKVKQESNSLEQRSSNENRDWREQPQVIKQTKPYKEEEEEENVKYCQNHRQKRVQAVENQFIDPIAEYKMRVARAQELARRNMQTKPLHQTSYPLELDTFDTTDLTEYEIKRGNVAKQTARPPQRPPPQPPVQLQRQQQLCDSPPRQQPKLRQALSNCSNTPPVARRVYKKAEAFIV